MRTLVKHTGDGLVVYATINWYRVRNCGWKSGNNVARGLFAIDSVADRNVLKDIVPFFI